MKDERERDLKVRTRRFALAVMDLTEGLPKTRTAEVIGRQLLRSGTSVGAQYREACRAKSVADFVSKIEGSLQELEETAYWLELLEGSSLGAPQKRAWLTRETDELLAIFVTVAKNAKKRKP